MSVNSVERPLASLRGQKSSVRSGRNARARRQTLIAAAFLLPNFLGFLAFTFLPVIISFWMSFTNWSLKPAVKFEYVGLRNFNDLIGVHPVAQGVSAFLLCAYVVSILGFLAGVVGALWCNIADWIGTRIGSALIAVTGFVFGFIGIAKSSDGLVLGGIVAIVCGVAGALRDSDFRIGVGTVPGALICISSFAMLYLHPLMAQSYAPNDNYFYFYLYNTCYLMLGIPIGIGGSLALALLLNETLPTGPIRQRMIGAAICVLAGLVLSGILWVNGSPDAALICLIFWIIAALGITFNVVVFRTLFYLPTFTAGVALMILWMALYNPETGPIDVGLSAIFSLLHITATPPLWLADVRWAKAAMIIMGVWTGIGGTNMLLYLAGLSNVPKELLDAAEVDGAGVWNKFRHVTWPQLAPTTFFISIMSIIGGLQGGFDQARVMTQGGPAGSTTTLAYYIYQKAFSELDMGYAAAISWVLFIIVFVATAINWKFGKGLDSE